jgi:dephospho-CoA kinase
MSKDQKVISITGGIGSGKSSVAEIVEKLGYKVIRSDETAKELMKTNSELKSKLIKKFGNNIYNGELPNKEFISSLIFGSDNSAKENREKINSIVHPYVIQDNFKEIEKHFSEGENNVFIESALTFEAGLEDGYDYIINVFTDEELVIKRLKARNNLSDEQVQARLDSQLSPQYKKSNSDFTIDNNGDLKALESSTKLIIDLVTNLPGKNPKKYEEDN